MKNLLMTARFAILELRDQNKILQTKVDVMDLFAYALRARVDAPPQIMGIDTVALLQQEIDRINEEEAQGK